MTHSAFESLTQHRIETLNLDVAAFRHRKTGALHYHLHSPRDENVFMVAFRTLPQDSTGVAHILEHTALCGSQRFPVRDPFFMMIRRSLNTFMNAFTSSDWTAYPFATQNRKDFDHLLQVYLDAAFFSRLDPLDFAQEGHRLEFSEMDNPDSELVYKGIVFNEMKGAMSSINSILWATLNKHLRTGTTYAHNSGGDPTNIPKLSHAQLLAFYKTHYHPSNSILMTYGNIPVAEHHTRIDELALQHFDKQNDILRAEKQQRFNTPRQIVENYPYGPTDNDAIDNKNYVLVSWMFGASSSLEEVLNAHLISGVLLENSASPLQQYLETTELGSAPSSLCGIDADGREIIFCCGIEGINAKNADLFEQHVLALLEKISKEGIDTALVESVLHQLELSQREITGSSYPYGLSLMLNALPGALHDGDPIQLLDIDPALKQLQQNIQDPQFICQLIEKYLVHNPHRLRLLMRPNTQLQEQQTLAEKTQLSAIAQALDAQAKQMIIEQSHALQKRQQHIDDPSILPKLNLEDIPQQRAFLQASALDDNACFYAQPTNGLVYQDIRLPLPALDEQQLELLPILTSCLSELGIGDQSYLQIQQQQSAATGGISAFYQIRNNSQHELQAYWGVSGKALSSNHRALTQLQLDCLNNVRFDEHQRIRELVQQMRASAENNITGSGHTLAMLAASSSQHPLAGLQHQLNGLLGITKLKTLDDNLKETASLQEFTTQLANLYAYLQQPQKKFLLIGEEKHREALFDTLTKIPVENSAAELFNITNHFAKQQLWLTQTQVNFCSKVFPSVSFNHEDAPALTVLSSFLRNGFLHRSIREQGGAYGGGAAQDNRLGLFKFYSYRDPRLVETLEDFSASIDWLLNNNHPQLALEEAIFTVVASIDKPSSPAGEARQDYVNNLYGIHSTDQARFRSGVLDLNIDDLQRVAQRYLSAEPRASYAIVSSEQNIATSKMDFSALGYQSFKI